MDAILVGFLGYWIISQGGFTVELVLVSFFLFGWYFFSWWAGYTFS